MSEFPNDANISIPLLNRSYSQLVCAVYMCVVHFILTVFFGPKWQSSDQ